MPDSPSGIDISDTVHSDIPEGMSLYEAAQVLELAGFNVSAPRPVPGGTRVDARIQPHQKYLLSSYSSSVSVIINAEGAGNDAKVAGVVRKILKP